MHKTLTKSIYNRCTNEAKPACAIVCLVRKHSHVLSERKPRDVPIRVVKKLLNV